MLSAWFPRVTRDRGSLPRILIDELARVCARRRRGGVGPWIWRKEGGETYLKVEFIPLHESVAEPPWALVFREVSYTVPAPVAWKARLTKREFQVAEEVINGEDNCAIATKIRCKENTVKKHVSRIFDKLGVDNRNMLLHRAIHEA